MTEFLLFCIATVGMTSIIVQGAIFAPFRQFIGGWAERVHHDREQKAQQANRIPQRSVIEWFDELINCGQCTGFWCGLFCGLFLFTSDPFIVMHAENDGQVVNRILMLFCCGVGGSFLAAFGCHVIEWVFYCKMNALRRLEEQDLMLAARRAEMQKPETQE